MPSLKIKSPSRLRKRVSLGILAFFVFSLWFLGTPNSICEFFANRALDARNPNATLRWTQFEKSWFGSTERLLVLETRAHLQFGEYASALQSVEELRDKNPGNAIADELKSLVAVQMGDKDRLKRLLTGEGKLLSLTDIFEASARCHLFNMDEDGLVNTFEHWSEFNPDDPAIEYYHGRWDEVSDRLESAIRHFEKAEKQSGSYLKPRFRKGILLRELRRFGEAFEAFDQMNGTDFESIAAVEAAYCVLSLGNAESAWSKIKDKLQLSTALQAQQYQRAEQFVEGDRFALVGGSILESLERYDEAMVLLRKALEANHRDSEARVLLIACLNRTGKPDEAARESKIQAEMTSGKLECKNLEEQLEVEAADYAKRIRYATLLFRYKSLGESQLETETLQKTFPGESETHQLLANIYRERARESAEWNLRADEQALMAQKLDAR